MNIDNVEIIKNGALTFDSIFEFDSLDITMLIDRCRRAGCTLRFENEDLTIDSSYNDDMTKRAIVTLYTLLAGHPKAAVDYIRFCVNKATKKDPNAE